MAGVKRIEPEEQCIIPFAERDRSLLVEWPNMEGLGEEWVPSEDGTFLTRQVEILESNAESSPPALTESVIRFPNAPVYLTHQGRHHTYEIKERWPNYHTMRVLTRDDLSATGASHIFLLHNGLNETRDIAFHYRLANWILAEVKDAACIIRPLPGHLNRYPFQSPFAELPLDEYLLDPATLFRQFLRYMLETRWLLSAIAPRCDYKVTTGCHLLLDQVQPGREDDDALATEITSQANRMLKASKDYHSHSPEPIEQEAVRQSVKGLRELLGWRSIGESPSTEDADRPAIHAVGYSMGGFVAQSVFCTWPFVVASCSNMFAGGALRDLAPTAFAHPEEWQSVLHGLQSELDKARVGGYFEPKDDPLRDDGPRRSPGKFVVGVEEGVFDYFNRIFTGVFLQADHGSYSTRLAEFSRRLLFILGGHDPIVRTRKVLDAAPPGGITLHQIGDMSHFPGNRYGERAEREQREYWLAEAGGMIGRFAKRAADLLHQSHVRWWRNGKQAIGTQESARSRAAARVPDGALPNMLFEHRLDELVDMVRKPGSGWLFIARNEIPTVFLGEHAFNAHAVAMHHAEDVLGEYAASLAERAKHLNPRQLSLLVPKVKLPGGRAVDDPTRFSKSEVAIRYALDKDASEEMREHFWSEWCRDGIVKAVVADEYAPEDLPEVGPIWASEHTARQIALTMLPDIWLAFDQEACRELLGISSDMGRDKIEPRMVKLACELIKEPKVEENVYNKARKLRDLCTVGSVRAIRVSSAELNPRYRGRSLDGSGHDLASELQQLLIYWAMAYQASSPYEVAKGDVVAAA